MVQVSAYAQWRMAAESDSVTDVNAGPANRRNMPTAELPAQADLRWRPGMTRAEAKARAKEMRKAAQERGERREYQRHLHQLSSSPSASPAASPHLPSPGIGECSDFALDRLPVLLQPPSPPEVEPPMTSAAETEGSAVSAGATAPSDTTETLASVVERCPAEIWSTVLRLLDLHGLRSFACTCTTLAALSAAPELWERHEARLYSPLRRSATAAGVDSGATPRGVRARRLCCSSDAAHQQWVEALSHRSPRELALAGMTSVDIVGELGVSTHEGRMVRTCHATSECLLTLCSARLSTARMLTRTAAACMQVRVWHITSGRRLAAYQSKAKTELSRCAAIGEPGARLAVVADRSGAFLSFDLEAEELAPRASVRLAEKGEVCHDLALLPVAGRTLCLAADTQGRLGAFAVGAREWLWRSGPQLHAHLNGNGSSVATDALTARGFAADLTGLDQTVCCFDMERPDLPLWTAYAPLSYRVPPLLSWTSYHACPSALDGLRSLACPLASRTRAGATGWPRTLAWRRVRRSTRAHPTAASRRASDG